MGKNHSHGKIHKICSTVLILNFVRSLSAGHSRLECFLTYDAFIWKKVTVLFLPVLVILLKRSMAFSLRKLCRDRASSTLSETILRFIVLSFWFPRHSWSGLVRPLGARGHSGVFWTDNRKSADSNKTLDLVHHKFIETHYSRNKIDSILMKKIV